MKRRLIVLTLLASFSAAALLSGCGDKGGNTGFTAAEQDKLKNQPPLGSTPPPEARAAMQQMQSGPPKGAVPPAAK